MNSLQIDLQYPGTPEQGSWWIMVFSCSSTKIRRKKRGAEPLSPSLQTLHSVSRSWWKSRTQATGLKDKTSFKTCLSYNWHSLTSSLGGRLMSSGQIWNTHVLPHFHRILFHNSTCNGHDCLHNCQDWSMCCHVEPGSSTKITGRDFFAPSARGSATVETDCKDCKASLALGTYDKWCEWQLSSFSMSQHSDGVRSIFQWCVMKPLATKSKRDLRETSDIWATNTARHKLKQQSRESCGSHATGSFGGSKCVLHLLHR